MPISHSSWVYIFRNDMVIEVCLLEYHEVSEERLSVLEYRFTKTFFANRKILIVFAYKSNDKVSFIICKTKVFTYN